MTSEQEQDDTLLQLVRALLAASLQSRNESATDGALVLVDQVLITAESPQAAIWAVAGVSGRVIKHLCTVLDVDAYAVLQSVALDINDL